MSRNIDQIIEEQKRKQKIWMLSQKQEVEEMSDDPTEAPVEEFQCPICYDQMDTPERAPKILFPCGHTICDSCLEAYMKSTGRKKCPVCNVEFNSVAINYSLKSVIAARPKESKPVFDFKNDLNIALQRFEILTKQLTECRSESKTVKSELNSAQIVLYRLSDELEFVKQQVKLQSDKVDSLKGKDDKLEKDIKSLVDLIGSLTTEIEKLRLLAKADKP